jgi:hypothetical protein
MDTPKFGPFHGRSGYESRCSNHPGRVHRRNEYKAGRPGDTVSLGLFLDTAVSLRRCCTRGQHYSIVSERTHLRLLLTFFLPLYKHLQVGQRLIGCNAISLFCHTVPIRSLSFPGYFYIYRNLLQPPDFGSEGIKPLQSRRTLRPSLFFYCRRWNPGIAWQQRCSSGI